MASKIVKCLDCNKPFTISPNHEKWFMDKGLELPKRCRECRNKRRSRKEVKDNGRNTQDI